MLDVDKGGKDQMQNKQQQTLLWRLLVICIVCFPNVLLLVYIIGFVAQICASTCRSMELAMPRLKVQIPEDVGTDKSMSGLHLKG